jgi:hypothetical protein
MLAKTSQLPGLRFDGLEEQTIDAIVPREAAGSKARRFPPPSFRGIGY